MPFRPGMVGGHCIGVDPYYLTHKAEEVGYNPQVILAGRRINDNMAKYAAKTIIKRMLLNDLDVPRSTIAVLGITFKENCPDIRNSKVVDLVLELLSWNTEVVVTDPWADPKEVKHEYDIDLIDFDSITDVSAVIVAVGHNEFRELSEQKFKQMCRSGKSVFGDLKSLFNRQKLISEGFDVFRL